MANQPIRLLYSLLCKNATPSGEYRASYTFKGVTNIILPQSYPYTFDYNLITCWLLDNFEHTERIEIRYKTPSDQPAIWFSEDTLPMAKKHFEGDVHISVIPPEDIKVDIPGDSIIVFCVFLDGKLVHNQPAFVHRIQQESQKSSNV